MRKLNKIIKQLVCKHDYFPWANVHGDLINDFNCRTVLLCRKCYKRKMIKPYISAPYSYNYILHCIYKLQQETKNNKL